MDKREINVTELGNFATHLDTISSYFDDSLNKIGSGFRNLNDEKIVKNTNFQDKNNDLEVKIEEYE